MTPSVAAKKYAYMRVCMKELRRVGQTTHADWVTEEPHRKMTMPTWW